jgi:hypothetical protein
MKRLHGTWLACLVGSLALASACGDEDSDNPANSGGKGGSGGDSGGSGGTKGGSSGDAGTGGTSGTAGKGGTGGKGGASGATGGTDNPGGDGGMGNEGGGGSGGMGPDVCDVYDPSRPIEDIPVDDDGDVIFPASNTLTLTNDTTWRINGRIWVGDGKTLNIEPCTLVVGTPKPNAGSLFVMRGGKLNAIGTPNEPIVFSSESHRFLPQTPWGGVVLLGRAPIGQGATVQTPAERLFEGLPATEPRALYGGADQADDSGTLQYVRIEYGGDIIVSDKEINGLTLAGVGNGTELDHIMVKRQRDDCFEFFGGTVNAHHLICENTGDDMFDTDELYRGYLQFLFGRLNIPGTSADPNGFEWDGNQAYPASTDHSIPHAANATLCGFGASVGAQAYGALFRRNIDPGTKLVNTIVTGFDNGLDTRDIVSDTGTPRISWTHSLFFENFRNNYAHPTTGATTPATNDPTNGAPGNNAGDDAFDELAWITTTSSANSDSKPAGFDCFSAVGEAPNHPYPNTRVAGTPAGAGFADPNADYVGAFENVNDDWMTGLWVDWSTGN